MVVSACIIAVSNLQKIKTANNLVTGCIFNFQSTEIVNFTDGIFVFESTGNTGIVGVGIDLIIDGGILSVNLVTNNIAVFGSTGKNSVLVKLRTKLAFFKFVSRLKNLFYFV